MSFPFIVRGRHYLSGELSDLWLDSGEIQSIRAVGKELAALGGEEYWIAPGLVDLQVNGYRGHDFCSGELTPGDVAAAAQDLAEAGVTAFCPTVTTGAFETMAVALDAVARACEESAAARERIVGIHLEGPYISPEDGPRGAHPRAHVRVPDWAEFKRLQDAAGGRIRVITLAPELPGAIEFIAQAAKAGLVVALGHHAAPAEAIEAAVAAGAVLSTHLGNGAHSVLPRHPNYIWEQLANDALCASIIADGHHLGAAVVKSFYRVKGARRLILVSDAVAAAGMPAGEYQLMGQKIDVKADGSVHLAGTPYLAGSVLKLADAVPNMMRLAGASFGEAVEMASTNPARLLGLGDGRGDLAAGGRADLTVFSVREGQVQLAATVCRGELCYRATDGSGNGEISKGMNDSASAERGGRDGAQHDVNDLWIGDGGIFPGGLEPAKDRRVL